MRCSGRKHTPIVSEKQRGMFGAELARRRGGGKGRMAGITTGELEGHLKEAGGKKLPKRSRIGHGHWPKESTSAGGSKTAISRSEFGG